MGAAGGQCQGPVGALKEGIRPEGAWQAGRWVGAKGRGALGPGTGVVGGVGG